MTKAFSLHVKDLPSFSVKQVEQRVVLNYIRIQTNSNKFYIMEFQEGVGDDGSYRIYIEYGRVGRPPRRHERCFLSRSKAREEFDKILKSKRKKGYELILIEEEWDKFSRLPLEDSVPNKTIQLCSQSPSLSIHTPLGKLSELQIHRGIHILTEIEQNIHNGTDDVMDLSNEFYSVIPVAFGSQIDKSYLLDTMEKVQERKEWLFQMINNL
jgi:predicted DNA-binding WGR domain protein